MSVYLVNKILYMTDNDADFRKRMRDNAEETVKSFPLSGEEIEALITGGRWCPLSDGRPYFLPESPGPLQPVWRNKRELPRTHPKWHGLRP